MKTWKTLSRETILDHGKFLRVENHQVELPDGRIIDNWSWVITPDYINVLLETNESKFLFFRQTKYAIEGISLAPVGGYLEPGEEPLAAAQREVLEETGYRALEWIDLGSYPVEGNRGAGTAHLFLARGAYRVQERNADDLEEQHIVLMSRAETENALLHGDFQVLAWSTVVALGLLRLAKPKEEIMPEIKHFPKRRVAFVSETGPWRESIQRGFGRLFTWLGTHQVQPIGSSLGIFYDDPAKVAPDKLRSDLCVPVADDVIGSGEVHVKDLGGFEAATIQYQGDANIMRAYNEVYDWLHAQGYRDAGAPIEVYLSQPGEELRAEVIVPITKFEEAPEVPQVVVVKKVVRKAAKKPAKKTAAKKSTAKAKKK